MRTSLKTKQNKTNNVISFTSQKMRKTLGERKNPHEEVTGILHSMYENGKMRLVETTQGMVGGGIKENDGGSDIL
jgi:hypothetical protein